MTDPLLAADFLRQEDILAPDDIVGLDVDIVGAGALGGAIASVLAKMGFGLENEVRLTDFDRCERHNLPTQWFRAIDVQLKKFKVAALADYLSWLCKIDPETHVRRFTGSEARELGPVVVLSVDSLEERAKIWENVRDREDVELLIDGRMGAEVGEIFAYDRQRDDPETYASSLRGQAIPLPCTRQGIVYTPMAVASYAGAMIRAYALGYDFPRHVTLDMHHFLFEAER